MEVPRILVVDDEEVIRDSCRQILQRCRYGVETARDAYEALRFLRTERIDLVLLDLRMPGLDGTELLGRIRQSFPELDVVIITGYSSVGSAVDCMRLGAYDYLPKPFDADSLRLVVARALEKRRLALENEELRRRLEAERPPDSLLGESPAIGRIREMIEKVGPSNSTVLILGESGTGKELVARAIHRASPRRDHPFVTVDCGALVESLFESELFGHVRGAFTGAVTTRPGRFELAQGGTIFLDEIGNIGPAIQSKLLRVLQEKETTRVGGSDPIHVDARILAATNQDLKAGVRAGRFREDLFYRIGVVVIEIPPLRARREDIPMLADGLLERLCEHKQFPSRRLTSSAVAAMAEYDWPGNVRELENTLERALLLARGPEIVPADLQFVEVGSRAWSEGDGAAPVGTGRSGMDPARTVGTKGQSGMDGAGTVGTRGQSGMDGAGTMGTNGRSGTNGTGVTPGSEMAPSYMGPDGAASGAIAYDRSAALNDLSLAALEEAHIRRVLEQTSWRLGRAASLLGIDRKTLWRKIRTYHLR